ncbi:putative group 3/4 sigma-70 RNA polymerase sigma factor [Calothrix brevissima NIES-22]|nr:putative group 3/4 sigma-70 RNA polymerase sigma factor [Calothrix brevissima NIES-22]
MIFAEFFTFPLLKEDAKGQKYIFWQVDQQLQQYIHSLVNQKPNISKPELVRIILHNFQNDPKKKLNRRVWSAFLSRFSYKAAWEIRTNIVKISARVDLDRDTLFHELLQISLTSALAPEKCLDNLWKYPEYENLELHIWYYKFAKYVNKRMTGFLCDKLREIEGLRTFQRSDLGLAARVTKTRVVTVLQRLGLNEVTILHYTLVWQCFQEAKDGGLINFSSPQPQAFDAICSRYQQFSCQLPQLLPEPQTVDGTVIQQWLQEIGKAIRNYIDFAQVSLDEPISQDAETLTRLDLVPDENSIIQGNDSLRYEIREYLHQLREQISYQIDRLQPEAQRIPLFLHGLNLSQEKIGVEIGANQSTVGRRYKKTLWELLSHLGTWAKEYLKIDLSSEKLNDLKTYLQEYLDGFYYSLMHNFLNNSLQALASPLREIMRLFWLQQMHVEQIAKLSNLSLLEVEHQLKLGKETLNLDIITQIAVRINMPLANEGIASKQVGYLMDDWLKTADFGNN